MDGVNLLFNLLYSSTVVEHASKSFNGTISVSLKNRRGSNELSGFKFHSLVASVFATRAKSDISEYFRFVHVILKFHSIQSQLQ